MTISEIKSYIRESLKGSEPKESYDKSLIDDESMDKEGKIVYSKDKEEIKSWIKDMGLS